MVPEIQPFECIWLLGFESCKRGGGVPVPNAAHAEDLRTGRSLWLTDPLPASPPFSMGEGALFVGFRAERDLACWLALGWALPSNVLDLYAEFRCLVAGVYAADECDLHGALRHFGVEPPIERGVVRWKAEAMRRLLTELLPH